MKNLIIYTLLGENKSLLFQETNKKRDEGIDYLVIRREKKHRTLQSQLLLASVFDE